MLAHEFRNPLAPIRSAVEIMRVIGQKDPALEKAREMISRQVDHLSRLVDQLLDVSHMTQGTIALRKEALDVNAVLWRAVGLAQPLIEERGQSFRMVPLGEPVEVEGDLERLTQVVRNLLDNATRYTNADGKIELSAEKEEGCVAIRVKDDGMGIARESLASIFDLFTQAHRSPERPQGLGIGLTLVRNIIELHGGSVAVESAGLGHGAEFTVRLPLRHARADSADQPLTPASGRESSISPSLPGGQRATLPSE